MNFKQCDCMLSVVLPVGIMSSYFENEKTGNRTVFVIPTLF